MPYGPALQAWKRHCGAGAIFRERAWEESSGKWSKNIQHGYMTIKWPLYDHLPQSKSSGKCLPRYFTSFLGYFYEYPVTVVSPGVETKPNALPEMFIFGRTALQSCHILARINGRWKILANKNQRNIGNSCCCNSCILNPGLIIKSGLITPRKDVVFYENATIYRPQLNSRVAQWCFPTIEEDLVNRSRTQKFWQGIKKPWSWWPGTQKKWSSSIWLCTSTAISGI